MVQRLLIVLFLLLDGHPRDLHSFPTRRSSDLRRESVPPACTSKKQDVIGLCSLDRKSTRLNSSHLGISYAVFCLKKKVGGIAPTAESSDEIGAHKAMTTVLGPQPPLAPLLPSR